MFTHARLLQVLAQIEKRSKKTRQQYLTSLNRFQTGQNPNLSCSNLAHGVAVLDSTTKEQVKSGHWKNIGIVTAYNDMLSSHHPYESYPKRIKHFFKQFSISAQVAGGVPAMCDGVTQGQPSMELSLFSRDVIARATAVAYSHDLFSGMLLLGICDKIVPGLLIGALHFGHLPAIVIPAGPMPSGLSNEKKAKVRQQYAKGELDKQDLLKAEMQCYHSPGTCTFYGTANTNQMLLEFLGLHLPGASFVAPNTPLRNALTEHALKQFMARMAEPNFRLGIMLNEKAWINAIVGLLATGGSTNATLHITAMAKAAGILITWEDYQSLAETVPLLAHVYPNGQADVNQFHQLGGLPFCIKELLQAGLLFEEVETLMGPGLNTYTQHPHWQNETLSWKPVTPNSTDTSVLRPYNKPFTPTGGLTVVEGNLGRAIVKISALKSEQMTIEAPACVFHCQHTFQIAYQQQTLNKDCVFVIRFQGPQANGMPELHKLMPILTNLQDQGYKVALITDGRMSGASGRVLAAIHCVPEAIQQGGLAKVRSGDIIRLDIKQGLLNALVDENQWQKRIPTTPDSSSQETGFGRELFSLYRKHVTSADKGATSF